ncbi:MAG: ABC transporter ATP-binding protein [Aquamicrobium sp.]|uniref:dipeptide ABC transporter ATP-binding protein n=1 Tax=Aquamicrobium sp. TaxID=1872579 RepID=UPI00349EA249|nr:ABC transporter ATP-binding protein [Aquamicrobium sp.]
MAVETQLLPVAKPADPILEIEGLRLAYRIAGRARETVRGVSFSIGRGEAYGLVGESGCGKSTVAFSAVHYLPDNVVPLGGSIRIAGREVSRLSAGELMLMRKSIVSMVYQSASTALNPTLTIARQVAEVFELKGLSGEAALRETEAALRKVKISDVAKVMRSYPHQLSGGMQQRVVIAMAISASPELIILDEPTTGLDATVEADIIDLLRHLGAEMGVSYLFISHNLGLVAQVCDRVGVLYAGRLVEEGDAGALFRNPRHPYTSRLLRCAPNWGAQKADGPLETIPGFPPRPGEAIAGCVFEARCPLAQPLCSTTPPPAVAYEAGHVTWCHRHQEVPSLAAGADRPARPAGTAAHDASSPVLLEVRQLDKSYGEGPHRVRVLSGIDLAIRAGEVLGIVGESGSGKSTLAKVITGLEAPDDETSLVYAGSPLPGRVRKRSAEQTRAIQMVFQDPGSSLNPSHSVGQILSRTIRRQLGLSGTACTARIDAVAGKARLDGHHIAARPVELSGGLKQRVAIARAIAGEPRLVICDEPTSALDVSVQAAIVNLLADLQRTEGLSLVFVSHDLGVVRYISDRIMVLYLGRVMEIGPAAAVFDGPHHPYTEALLSAAPQMETATEDRRKAGARRIALKGEIPRHSNPPTGCVFHTRCFRKVGAICETEAPPCQTDGAGHEVFCHIPLNELGRQSRPSRTSAPRDTVTTGQE